MNKIHNFHLKNDQKFVKNGQSVTFWSILKTKVTGKNGQKIDGIRLFRDPETDRDEPVGVEATVFLEEVMPMTEKQKSCVSSRESNLLTEPCQNPFLSVFFSNIPQRFIFRCFLPDRRNRIMDAIILFFHHRSILQMNLSS